MCFIRIGLFKASFDNKVWYESYDLLTIWNSHLYHYCCLSDDIHVKFFSQMTFTILRNITTYFLDTKALLLFGEIIINQVLMNVNIYIFHLNYFVPAISKFSPKSFAYTLPLYWGSIAQIYIWFIIKLECYIW